MATAKTVPTTQADAGVKADPLDHVHAVQWKIGKAVHMLKKALDQYEDELDEARTLLTAMAATGRSAGLDILVEETDAAEQGARWYGRDLDSTVNSLAFSDVVQID